MTGGKIDFSKKIYREKTIQKIDAKLKLLGNNKPYDSVYFLNIRTILTIVIFIILIYYMDYGYILGPILAFSFYILFPKITLDVMIKKRIKSLEKDSMYFFEILTLSLESGRNLYNALEITSENIDSELSEEFKYALTEVKYGKSLDEALEDIKYRIPSDTINNILLNIRESNIFGNNIVETLYNQIDYITDKRTMEMKETINKIPMKISVVSVVFMIPLIMLLILGPVLIEYFIG